MIIVLEKNINLTNMFLYVKLENSSMGYKIFDDAGLQRSFREWGRQFKSFEIFLREYNEGRCDDQTLKIF